MNAHVQTTDFDVAVPPGVRVTTLEVHLAKLTRTGEILRRRRC